MATLVLLAGCAQRDFRASGVLASDGGALGRWSSAPEGCRREVSNGQPAVSFAWFDPYIHDRLSPEQKRWRPNVPLWLEVDRGSSGVSARLGTVWVQSVRLDASSCSTLELTTSEGKPVIAGGRPTLGGTLLLDCRVNGSHVTAAVRFSACEY